VVDPYLKYFFRECPGAWGTNEFLGRSGWCFLDKESHQKVLYFNKFHEMTFHKNSFEQAHLIRLKSCQTIQSANPF